MQVIRDIDETVRAETRILDDEYRAEISRVIDEFEETKIVKLDMDQNEEMRESSDFEESKPTFSLKEDASLRRFEPYTSRNGKTDDEYSNKSSQVSSLPGENERDPKSKRFIAEKQVSWVDDKNLIRENQEIRDEDTKEELERRHNNEEEKREKGSKAMKTFKLIRQKTVEYVHGKETEWKSNLSKVNWS